MLILRAALLFGAVLLAGACDRPSRDAVPGTSGSRASETLATAASSGAAKPAPAPEEHVFTGFRGTLGHKQELRMALARSGTRLRALVGPGGAAAEGDKASISVLAGEMKDNTRFVLQEPKAASVEGRFVEGGRIEGSWKDPKSRKPLAFSAAPLAPFGPGDDAFDGSFEGQLGKKSRIRAELHRAGTTLNGLYRYARSRDDLKLEGTLTPSTGVFSLRETEPHGKLTGRLDGILIGRDLALGRWSSPDGKRSFDVELRPGRPYLPITTLQGGAKVLPEEDIREVSPGCRVELVYPKATGLASKEAEGKLNSALMTEAKRHGIDKEVCEGHQKEEMEWSAEVQSRVVPKGKGFFGVRFDWSAFLGGAHGTYGSSCFVADTGRGALVNLSALFAPDGKKELARLVNEALRKEHGVTDLTEAGFFVREAEISDGTALCVTAKGLTVEFQHYEVTPHVMPAPHVDIPAKDARTLFVKVDLTSAVFE